MSQPDFDPFAPAFPYEIVRAYMAARDASRAANEAARVAADAARDASSLLCGLTQKYNAAMDAYAAAMLAEREQSQ